MDAQDKTQPGRRGRKPKTRGAGEPPLTAVDKAYQGMRDLILSYDIRPGERLNELELASRIGVSRTPLREALNRLVAERLLSFEPSHGFACPELRLEDIIALYEYRVLLETTGIRLAVARATDAEIEDLVGFWRAASQDVDAKPTEQLIADDEELHVRVIALSHNKELVYALKYVNARIHFIRWANLLGDEAHAESYRQHMHLLEVLRNRDPDEAERTIRGIIERRTEEIVDILKEGAAKLYIA